MKFYISLAMVLGFLSLSIAEAKPVAAKVLKAELLDKKSEKTLFRFTRTQNGDSVTRHFVDLDGKLVVAETVSYSGDQLQRISFEQHQLSESGELDVKNGKIHFKYTKDGKTKTDEEKQNPTTISIDQIFTTLMKNWEALMKGETIHVRLIVLDRLETVGFKFFKEKDLKFKDKDVTVIKMKPASFIIAAIVDPLFFYFDKTEQKDSEQKLIQVIGRTVPKIKDDSKWKNLDAILRFE